MTNWTLPGADGQTIYGSTDLPIGEARGSILLVHGFKGYKDYGFLPWLGQQAADAGLIALRFNFSHSGVTDDPQSFARPDLFQRDTWSKQVFDMLAVAQAVAHGTLAGMPAEYQLPMVWFGHSRGGVTCLLAARQAFQNADHHARPVGIVSAAAPSGACNLDLDQQQLLRQQGYLDSPSSRTGQLLRIGVDWLDDLERGGEQLDPARAIAAIDCPIMIVHGSDDQTVPLQAAHTLHEASGRRAQLRIVPGATHTFNAPNPMPSPGDAPGGAPRDAAGGAAVTGTVPPPQTRELADLTIQFALGCVTGGKT